jgi:hypothetical protein
MIKFILTNTKVRVFDTIAVVVCLENIETVYFTTDSTLFCYGGKDADDNILIARMIPIQLPMQLCLKQKERHLQRTCQKTEATIIHTLPVSGMPRLDKAAI